MHPVLFQFDTPSFLRGIFPDTITIYTYGFLIAIGAVLAFFYTARQAKKQYNVPMETTQWLITLLIIAAVVGGKLFIFFEDPSGYLKHPGKLVDNFANGFVFYGSFIFAIPTMLWFFRHYKLPTLGMLDIIAGTTLIVHGTGRLGCFMAGCCYGVPTDSFLGVTFTNPQCAAEPLNTPLHPTQLYSSLMIFAILAVIIFMKDRKKFDGQLFLLYIMLYAIGRSVIEVFRGDISRGYVIEGVLTNSQFIAGLMFLVALYFYVKLSKKAKQGTSAQKRGAR